MFDIDLYPGKPKILFIGNPTSSHVQGWINLLANTQLNIRLFASADGYPPNDWPVKVYLTTKYPPIGLNNEFRKSWWPEPEKWFAYENELKIYDDTKKQNKNLQLLMEFQQLLQNETYSLIRLFHEIDQYILTTDYKQFQQQIDQSTERFGKLLPLFHWINHEYRDYKQIFLMLDNISTHIHELQVNRYVSSLLPVETEIKSSQMEPPCLPQSRSKTPQSWLAEIIKEWKPDIIHTFGLDAGSKYYFDVRREFQLEDYGKWIIKIFGGSDLFFNLQNPDSCRSISDMFSMATQVLFDNQYYIKVLIDQGLLSPEKVSPLSPIPGSGGVDVDDLVSKWQGNSEKRRVILWPKSYETTWSKAVPVLLALRNVWDDIQPCEIYMLTITGEMKAWFSILPEEMKAKCHIYEGLPRSKVLELMLSSRVMLAPSLIDGIPNTMYEAMACGAIPIVSPLDTIKSVVDDQHVLFADNLDQPAIERAIVRAMNNDKMVEQMSRRNISLVKQLADTDWVRPKVQQYYRELAV